MIEQFHRPSTIKEALSLKTRFKGRAVFLAGGTFVNSADHPVSAEHCISLEGLKLDHVEENGTGVVIGALCTLQQLIEQKKVPAALKEALSQVVSRNIRNMATIGGHVSANESHSDLIPMLVALDAKVRLSGVRTTSVTSVLDYIAVPKEGLITRVFIPRAPRGRVAACCNFRRSANARSMLTAAVSLTPGRAAVKDPILALGGVAGRVVRLTSVEKVLDGKPLPAIDEIARMVSRSVNPSSTPFESSAFRKYQAGVVVSRALQMALQRGGDHR